MSNFAKKEEHTQIHVMLEMSSGNITVSIFVLKPSLSPTIAREHSRFENFPALLQLHAKHILHHAFYIYIGSTYALYILYQA
mgnify:CR=1 FL=1